MLSRILGGNEDAKEVKTEVLKIRGKTLIFANTIYQIPNISIVEVGKIQQRIPVFALLLVIAGLFILLASFNSRYGSEGIIGLVIGAMGAIWIYAIWSSPKHGLRLVTNSGESTLIISPDLEFLKRVSLVLYNIMNDKMSGDVNLNFDQKTIVEVGEMQGSAIVIGNVQGDVVSNI
jgi:hypothetical protein